MDAGGPASGGCGGFCGGCWSSGTYAMSGDNGLEFGLESTHLNIGL